ncbi:hypothetical protein TKK_0014051 [Trichogramma kaykai]
MELHLNIDDVKVESNNDWLNEENGHDTEFSSDVAENNLQTMYKDIDIEQCIVDEEITIEPESKAIIQTEHCTIEDEITVEPESKPVIDPLMPLLDIGTQICLENETADKNSKTSNANQKNLINFEEIFLENNFYEDELGEIKQKTSSRRKKSLKDKPDEPYKCNLCPKIFDYKRYLNKHIVTVHITERPFQCDWCKKAFAFKNSLKKHFRLMHTIERPFECEICKKKFEKEAALTKHVNFVHINRKIHKCDICSKQFTTNCSLRKHQDTRHFQIRKYECELCQKNFTQKGVLNKHIKDSHGQITHKCDLCRETFSRETDFKNHVYDVHELVLIYQCVMCPKSFQKQFFVLRHMENKHGKIEPYHYRCMRKSEVPSRRRSK